MNERPIEPEGGWVGDSPEWIEELRWRDREHPGMREAATRLHAALCQMNHTDVCSWMYDEHEGEDAWHREDSALRHYIDIAIGLRCVGGLDSVLDALSEGDQRG